MYALFRMLAARDRRNQRGPAARGWARAFVDGDVEPLRRMLLDRHRQQRRRRSTRDFAPEDVNSWSYLALQDPAYAASIDWDGTHLAVRDGAFSGVSFCSADRSKVWFEGTAHLADALAIRNGSGDAAKAQAYLDDIAHAQNTAPNHDGNGIVAASKTDSRPATATSTSPPCTPAPPPGICSRCKAPTRSTGSGEGGGRHPMSEQATILVAGLEALELEPAQPAIYDRPIGLRLLYEDRAQEPSTT